MVFRQPYAAICRRCNRKCDYSKIITPKMGLLSNYCFLIINYCYFLAGQACILVCFRAFFYQPCVKMCNFCGENSNFFVVLSNI